MEEWYSLALEEDAAMRQDEEAEWLIDEYHLGPISSEEEPEEKVMNNEAAAAFVKAQAEFDSAIKNAKAPIFNSNKQKIGDRPYVNLEGVLNAVKPALNSNGLALIQRPIPNDQGVSIKTVFVHGASGVEIDGGEVFVPATKRDPQGYGSAMTYARRYGLMAACGIAQEDDDGEAAGKAQQEQRELAERNTLKQQIITLSQKYPTVFTIEEMKRLTGGKLTKDMVAFELEEVLSKMNMMIQFDGGIV